MSHNYYSVDATVASFEVVAQTDVYEILYANPSDLPSTGGTGGLIAATFEQSSPALQWTINHNLGRKPVVGVFSVGSRELEADVLHTSNNQTVVYFSVPTAGFARLI